MLMFSYNTSYHSTIMTTPFELLFGMKPRIPSLPHQDVQRVHYGESFASERVQQLQKARQVAKDNIESKTSQVKAQFDKKALAHNFKIGDLCFGRLAIEINNFPKGTVSRDFVSFKYITPPG